MLQAVSPDKPTQFVFAPKLLVLLGLNCTITLTLYLFLSLQLPRQCEMQHYVGKLLECTTQTQRSPAPSIQCLNNIS